MGDTATLVLVEVRSRSGTSYGDSASTVGPRKQLRFTRAARHLLLTRPDYRRLAARFDVVAIGRLGLPHHLVNAWQPGAF